MRITCGTSSPTYPIAPLTDTASPVSTDAETYTTSFTRVTSTPRCMASRSPDSSRFRSEAVV